VNEEEIKTKVILPYIESLGISKEDLSLERSFSIKLGKTVHTKTDKSENGTGRLDILCKKGNFNLFIIEVKADTLTISEDDISQGISYARLLPQIAPFVIVTNGKNTEVIDTITGKKINSNNIGDHSDFWKNNCKLSTEEDLKIRYEAIKNFIGYSKENLKAFSISQVHDRIESLKGNRNELNKKYIPEIYLENKELSNEFEEFLQGQDLCFAIIGESGIGKTNYICGLVDYYCDRCITLFFNGTKLVQDIPLSIREDVNWFFSQQLEPVEILRNIESLAEFNNIKICIFIDAIDEVTTIREFEKNLDEFLIKVKNFKSIKICITCKTNEWVRFLEIKGDPSFLSTNLYKPTKNCETHTKGFYVKRFSDLELKTLDSLYRSIFHYRGDFNTELSHECSLGFMFRLIAEVYQEKSLPTSLNSIDIFNKYLQKKFSKINNSALIDSYLSSLGLMLLKNEIDKNDYLPGLVKEDNFRIKLSLGINDLIIPELFSYDILTRIALNDGKTYIGFYNTKIRDYIVAIKSYKLHDLNNNEFLDILHIFLKNFIGQSSLSFYISVASQEHKKILSEYQQTRAFIFLNKYNEIINNNFLKLKAKFEPFTTGNIGLVVANLSEEYNRMYSFRPLRDDKDKQVEVLSFVSEKYIADDFFKLGAKRIKGKSRDFILVEPELAAKEEINEQLKKIVDDGKLNEENNINLIIEMVQNIIYTSQNELKINLSQESRFIPRIEELFPINYEDILKRIKLFFYRKKFEEDQIKQLIEDGVIKVEITENGLSYFYDQSTIDYNEIEIKVSDAYDKNIIISDNLLESYQVLSMLLKSIELLKNNNVKIEQPILPQPDIPIKYIDKIISEKGGQNTWIPNIVSVQYSDKQLLKYIEVFFKLFLQEYCAIIEYNFPTLKNSFDLYSKLPVKIYVEVSNDSCHYGEYSLGYGIKSIENKDSIVKCKINSKISKLSRLTDDKYFIIHYSSLGHYLNVNSPKFILVKNNYQSKSTDDYNVLRNFVYEYISKEFNKINIAK